MFDPRRASTCLKRAAVAAALALAAGFAPAHAQAQTPTGTGTVVLQLNDSAIEFVGRLRAFDGASYILETSAFGVLSLAAARYTCLDGPCPGQLVAALAGARAATQADTGTLSFDPGRVAEAAAIAISGSAIASETLLPALIRAHAASRGGTVKQLVGTDAAALRFRVADAGGRATASIDLKRDGTDSGLAALYSGTATVALASRAIGDAEAASLTQATRFRRQADEHVLALDGLVVIVPPASRVAALSLDQIAGIFSGATTNWSELGLPPGPITVYTRDGELGATARLAALVLRPRGLAMAPDALRVTSEAGLSDAVAADSGGIGVTSFAALRNARGVALATRCGLIAEPTAFAVKAEEYPLSRRIYLLTAGTPEAEPARDLVRFALSRAAQAVIRANDFVDQAIEQETFAALRPRIGAALAGSDATPADRLLGQRLLADLEGAQRLSVTFRFGAGSSLLDAKARQDIVRLAEFMQTPAMAGKTVLFVGFSDATGLAQKNVPLSARRALEVRNAVLAAARPRIPAARAGVRGFGSTAPVACNETAADKLLNRRVEVWVREPGR